MALGLEGSYKLVVWLSLFGFSWGVFLFLPSRLKGKGRCGSSTFICNLSQFCFLVCPGGSFSFVKSHWFQRSCSWALGSVLVDLGAGEGLWFGEKFCSKVGFMGKFPSWKMQVTVSRKLDRVIFPSGRGTGLMLERPGSRMQITLPSYASFWRNLKLQ